MVLSSGVGRVFSAQSGGNVRVSQLLESKGRDVATVSRHQSVVDALELLQQRRIGALVVTGEGGALVGIISERDVVRALATRGAGVLDESVAELMSDDVTTCTPDTAINELMQTMTNHRIRHVPVLEDGRLSGIISIGDVVKVRLDELEHEKRDLLDYVSAR